MPIDHKFLSALEQLHIEVLEEIASQSSVRVEAQLSSANAADQRSMASATLFATLATLLATALGVSVDQAESNFARCVSLFILSIGYFLSASACILSAKSREFNFPGVRPKSWTYDNWATKTTNPPDRKQFMVEYIAEIEKAIFNNKSDAENTAKIYNAGIDLAVVTSFGVFLLGACEIRSAFF